MGDESSFAQRLERSALDTLHANRLDGASRPGPHLYPHQWSWDAAFVAIGLAGRDRARGELRSLFAARWRNGMVPHVVFRPGAGAYFHRPEVWRAELAAATPEQRTSGILQAPLHASAVLALHRAAPDMLASGGREQQVGQL